MGIGQLKVVNSPATLIGRALGSCIGLMLYDESNKVGGMAHIMLPSSTSGFESGMPAKFADLAIPEMLERIEAFGGRVACCWAKVVGGAKMFNWETGIGSDIGARNAEAVKAGLAKRGIPVIAEDVGGDFARTVEFDTGNFRAEIKSMAHGCRRI